MDALIAASRTIHFASAMLLFGELIFVLAVAKPLWRGPQLGAVNRLLPLALAWGGWTLAASFISAAIWLAAESASMSGLPLIRAISIDTLGVVLRMTVFGQLWVWRFAICIALGLLLVAISRSTRRQSRLRLAAAAAVVAAAYLGTLAWSGHAAAAQVSGRYVHIVSDVVHVLAAGAWVGALPGLVVVLGFALPPGLVSQVVQRFSTLGLASVGALVATGLGNAWYLVGDVPALIGTGYGRLLLAKLILFVAMIALAAVNRWWLSVRLKFDDASGVRAQRRLRRSAAMELILGVIVVAIVGVLGVTVPAAHQSPVWPFDRTLSWAAPQQSLGLGAIAVVCAMAALLAAGVAIIGMRRGRWSLAIAGIAACVAGTATCAGLLAVPAYPTTYAASPIRYTTDAVVRGAGLYAQNCSACHGALGHGDGPAAASLSIVPADLAAHGSRHRPGELFWWIAHGIARTPMPAFAPRLSDAGIWDLVQFVSAQSDAATATALTSHAQPWLYAIAAPDFTYEVAGRGQQSLVQPQGSPVTLLVLYTMPRSLPYLHALAAEANSFKAIGLRVIAIPMPGVADSAAAELGANSEVIFATVQSDVTSAYRMLARRDPDPDAVPVQVAYLIDRQGYVRARWLGIPDSPPAGVAEVFDQAQLLEREPLRPPKLAGHAHF